MTDCLLFDGLVAVVQYARKDTDRWNNMAAFDVKSVAEKYAENLQSDDGPWEYRVVDIADE